MCISCWHMHTYLCGRWGRLVNFDGLKSLGVVFQDTDSRISLSDIWVQNIWNLLGICILKKTPQLTFTLLPG